MESVSQWWMWVAFFTLIPVVISVDLMLGGSKAHRVSAKEALGWSIVWIALAIIFNSAIWWYLHNTLGNQIANQKALEFFTGFIIEKSLSVENIFVFLMIFNYFNIPPEYQRRVLLYGILGAIIMRLIMIFLGAWLFTKVSFILYIFGAFLILTGIKMFWFADKQTDLNKNWLILWMRKHWRVTESLENERFFLRRNGQLWVTPLFLVLVLIEFSDIIFAVDSIPAIFAITTDPFIVVTSNIFAILGLRSLYFLMANVAERFTLLKYGLALILVLVGFKMLIGEFIKIPTYIMLISIALILTTFIVLSLRKQKVNYSN